MIIYICYIIIYYLLYTHYKLSSLTIEMQVMLTFLGTS